MRTITEPELFLRMRGGKLSDQFARIDTDPGKVVTHTVGGIEIDRQTTIVAPIYSKPYSFSFRYSVVRPMPSSAAAAVRSPLVY